MNKLLNNFEVKDVKIINDVMTFNIICTPIYPLINYTFNINLFKKFRYICC